MTIAQTILDDLWDFSDPGASEQWLRAAVQAETDAADRAELLTQVARAQGLQERYADGDATLDEIEGIEPAVRARVALERGRLRNSGGDAAAAVPLFHEAAEVAASAGLVFLQVDALHMLAIADAADAAAWTDHALEVLDGVTDPRTLRWRVSLHNNAGWARFDAGDRAGAIAELERAKDAAVRWGTREQMQWADEALVEARA